VTSLSAKKALRIVIPGVAADAVVVAALDTVIDDDVERTDLVEEEELAGEEMAEVSPLITETFVNALVGALVVLRVGVIGRAKVAHTSTVRVHQHIRGIHKVSVALNIRLLIHPLHDLFKER